jgi:5-methylcytosine-specific restriction endonuclease McrA
MVEVISRKQAMILGLTTYYTGKPCGRGHDTIRYASNHKCLDCSREHKKASLEHQRLRYKSDPNYAEATRQRTREYNSMIKGDPKRSAEVRIAKAAYARKRRASDPLYKEKEKRNVKKYRNNWSDEQKAKHRIHAKNRKAMLKGAAGRITLGDVRRSFESQNGICLACSVVLGDAFHVDHIMPIKLGGTNYPENIQILCPTCNLSKAAKHPDVWMREILNRGT